MKRVSSIPDKNSDASKNSLRVASDNQKKTIGCLTNHNLITSLSLVVVPEELNTSGSNTASYVIGIIVAFMILAYLVYSLLKPDKF
jgi:K+-transporting ATPase KdpF subunit